jgi:Ferritin-like domain
VQEVLESDLRLEQNALPVLREAIAHCETVRDFVTRDLLREILEAEEDHVDFFKPSAQFDLQNRHRKLYPAPIRSRRIAGTQCDRAMCARLRASRYVIMAT